MRDSWYFLILRGDLFILKACWHCFVTMCPLQKTQVVTRLNSSGPWCFWADFSFFLFVSLSLSLYFCYWYVKFRYEKNWVFVRSLVKSLGTPAQHIKLKVCPCLPRSFEAHQGQSLRPSSSSPSWGMVGTMWNLNLLWWCFSRFGTWKAVGCKSRNQRPAAGGHG